MCGALKVARSGYYAWHTRPERLSAAKLQGRAQSDPGHPLAKNLLQQDFRAKAPNHRWASDIAYIDTQQGWLYLAIVMNQQAAGH